MRRRTKSGPVVTVPAWIVDADISPRALQLAVILMDHADDENQCSSARKELARRMRCSANTIDRAMA